VTTTPARRAIEATVPDLVALSLGAGVQSTTLALLAIDGTLPKPDVAIFADTGWEPAAVYRQLDRIEAELSAAGVPVLRVSNGNIRRDAVDPGHRYASVPYFILQPPFEVKVPEEWATCRVCEADPLKLQEGCDACDSSGRIAVGWYTRPATMRERQGIGRRQCTNEYKVTPITRKIRELLGAAPPDFRRVPKGKHAEQWIGFSTDEIGRVNDGERVQYLRSRHPLLELGLSRKDCERYLAARGWGDTAKSACIGCPFHGNRAWRDLRDNQPEEWADAVQFDREIRNGGARGGELRGTAYLHRSRVPLDEAPIDKVTHREWSDAQVDLLDVIADEGDPDGCSPYGCRSGEPADMSDTHGPGQIHGLSVPSGKILTGVGE
jgi:hypothetical protein